jgi:nitroreductase
MHHPAETQYPLHELIRDRWSPVAFASRRIEPDVLGSLFEAARWAPSSYNEQPWSFLLATQDQPDEFAKLLGCLVPGNQTWAKHAYALVLSVAKLAFARNGSPNRHAYHDVGLATQSLFLEAQSHGIACHAMAGFEIDKAREVFQIPATHDPVAAIAIGYPVADYNDVDAALRQRDERPRSRKALPECLYRDVFGRSAGL